MSTYGELLSAHDVAIPPHLIADAEVPALCGPQRQGDLLIVPAATEVGGDPVGAGVQVVVGEATGNTHWLHGDPGVGWKRREDGQVVGYVTVPDDATAWLVHTDEHGANAMGPGVYEIRRQREQADQVRMVAD